MKARLGIADQGRERPVMFVFLGIVVGMYTAFAACTGSVYARRGPGGVMVVRDQSPGYFWVVIACYAALAIAMMTVF